MEFNSKNFNNQLIAPSINKDFLEHDNDELCKVFFINQTEHEKKEIESAKKIATKISLYCCLKAKNLEQWLILIKDIELVLRKLIEDKIILVKENENYNLENKYFETNVLKYLKILNSEFFKDIYIYNEIPKSPNVRQNLEFWDKIGNKTFNGIELKKHYNTLYLLREEEALTKKNLLSKGLDNKTLARIYLYSKKIDLLSKNTPLRNTCLIMSMIFTVTILGLLIVSLKYFYKSDLELGMMYLISAVLISPINYIFIDATKDCLSKNNNKLESPDWFLPFEAEQPLFADFPFLKKVMRFISTDRVKYFDFFENLLIEDLNKML